MYTLQISSAFKTDFKRIAKNKKLKKLVEDTLELLISGNPLPAKYKEHPLKGNLSGYLDAHILPDLIIIFSRDALKKQINLVRLGNHSNLNIA
jgi:mRNA interferase YafQ